MPVIIRNVIALAGVILFFWVFGIVAGRLAYEGHDLGLPDSAVDGLLVGVSVIAAFIANRAAFSSISSRQVRWAARGSAIAAGSAIYAIVSVLATVQV